MTDRLAVAVLASTGERRRALVALVEAAGHRVVEAGAEIVLVEAGADAALIEAALRAAAASVGRAPGFAAAASDVAPSPLTPREAEILSALGEGYSNKEVARELGISAHTVKFHLETIFRKLDVTSRAEAVAKGLRQGILEI
jgi:DNA-binding NarL/FixJ family response regulator